MQLFFLPFILGFIFVIGNSNAKTIENNEEFNYESNPQVVTNVDHVYDMTMHPRRYSSHRYQQKSNQITTTQRPFVSYWQNLMRNVRLPVPRITWNVTNPLANLFSTEHEELTPLEDEIVDDYYNESSQRRHKNKKRRKQHNKRHQKHKRPLGEIEEEVQEYELENSAPQTTIIQQPQQYPTINNNVDLNTPMYFYDPNTNAYYAVQRVRALGAVFNAKGTNEMYEVPKPNEQVAAQVLNEKITKGNEAVLETNDDEDDDDINLDDAEEIDLDKVAKNEALAAAAAATEPIGEQPKDAFIDEETLRNVLGTFMRDDSHNRQKQTTKEKRKKFQNYKQQIKPRKQLNYYLMLDVN